MWNFPARLTLRGQNCGDHVRDRGTEAILFWHRRHAKCPFRWTNNNGNLRPTAILHRRCYVNVGKKNVGVATGACRSRAHGSRKNSIKSLFIRARVMVPGEREKKARKKRRNEPAVFPGPGEGARRHVSHRGNRTPKRARARAFADRHSGGGSSARSFSCTHTHVATRETRRTLLSLPLLSLFLPHTRAECASTRVRACDVSVRRCAHRCIRVAPGVYL